MSTPISNLIYRAAQAKTIDFLVHSKTSPAMEAPSKRMDMPGSLPASTPPLKSWTSFGTKLPISYRVAIVLGVVVLVVTLVSLCVLFLYIRQQYRRRRLHHAVHGQEAGDRDAMVVRDDLFDSRGRDRERRKHTVDRRDSVVWDALDEEKMAARRAHGHQRSWSSDTDLMRTSDKRI